jgi:hypothetical protein
MPMPEAAPDRAAVQRIAVDAHVHLHRVDRHDLLAATANLARAGGTIDGGMLLLTESHGCDMFSRLVGPGFAPTDEAGSVLVEGADVPLAIVAGRQAITSERIELLLLGMRDAPPDGLPLDELLERAAGDEVIAVLPWGVGKWTGARRRLVRKTLAAQHGRVLVGDIPARPRLWRDDILQSAKAMGVTTLSGTDPLPLPGEAARIGSFGQIVAAAIDWRQPATSLFEALCRDATSIVPFGRPLSLPRFAALQIGLRMPQSRPAAAA